MIAKLEHRPTSFLRTVAFLLAFVTGVVFTACSNGCTSCQDETCMSCKSAFFLTNGICSKCPDDCASCNSYDNCTSCKPKKFGLNARCTFNCVGSCFNGECHDDTGYCIQCKPRLYGPKCQYNCNLCTDEQCDLRKCSRGCRDGYYEFSTSSESFCQLCPSNCRRCNNGTICYECNDKFYPYKFNNTVHCLSCSQESQCSDYCIIQDCHKCQIISHTLICKDCPEEQRHNGVSCEPTTSPCSQECSVNCDGYGICHGECNNGWSGEKCLEKCHDNCLKCSKENNNICQQCKDGFYSTNCSLDCNQSCIVEESRHTCISVDDYCLNGCRKKSWGETCNKTCPIGCKDEVCDRNTGQCEMICKDGSTAEECITTTTSWRKESTSSTVLSVSQPTIDGEQEEQREGKTNDIVIIGSAVGGGVLVLILIIVVGICLITRRRKQESIESVHNDHAATDDQIVYAKPMKKTNVVQETQDYIYAQPDKSHKPKKHSKKEIGQPSKIYDNVAIDLDDEKEVSHSLYSTIALNISDERVEEAETDVDDIELEELDDGNSKLIEREVKPPNADLYYNTESLIRSRIKVSDFLEYSKKKTNYESEFEKLPKGLTRPCDVALMRNNRLKNRYNGVYAYDATRVFLQSKTYINANYIDGHTKSPEYIASLGPTKSAMNDFKDFWEMVWEEKTDKIIVLTNLEESGKMKCEKYWPDQGKTQNYQGYKVFSLAETVYSEFTTREFTVGVKGSEPRKVTQYHYTAWPDRSVPDNVASLIEFRNKVEQTQSRDAGPVVVHCSAGIGRTGTYIALDTLIQEGKDDNYVDIFGRVMALRGQRGHMVQNLEQYIFVHQCLLYALTCDVDPLPATVISRTMTEDTISHQFQTFSEVVIPKTFDRKSSANKKVRKENRNGADIPGDQYRVRLCSSKHDYINAVFVNGYKDKNKFILTQTPLPNTVEDFISMIYHEKCVCVVDLDDDDHKDKSIGHYLPTDGKTFKVGYFQVTCKKSDTMEHATIRDLTISCNGLSLSDEVHVKHYQYKGWKQTEKVPSRLDTFVKLIKDVEDGLNARKSDKPIVVHCLTGAERSCVFCAVSIISEKCFFEKEISVLNTICQLQSRRKTAFSDVSQLQFCYQFVISNSTNLNRKQYYNMAKLL